jgi:hypothetical protein
VKYFEDAKNIWASEVPKLGQSQTVQGELLRAVEKLRDESSRNGNGNWDEGFELLLAYLRAHLLDPNVFLPQQLAATREALDRIANYADPCTADDLFDELGDRVVEYFRHQGSRPHERNPRLLR